MTELGPVMSKYANRLQREIFSEQFLLFVWLLKMGLHNLYHNSTCQRRWVAGTSEQRAVLGSAAMLKREQTKTATVAGNLQNLSISF